MNGIDIQWIDVLSDSEFRNIISRYEPHRLGPLRAALIAKSNEIQDQRMTPRSMKVKRDGFPMNEVEYEDWSARARTAQDCTDRHIGIVTEQMRQPHNWGNGGLVDAIEDLCDQIEHALDDPAELAPARIVRHYLDSVRPRSQQCHS